MKIQLTPSEEVFIKRISNVISVDNENWFFMPFWYKDLGNGRFEEVGFEQLPENVKEYIKTKQI